MKKIRGFVAALLIVMSVITYITPVQAKAKYTKTEKKLGSTLANFQYSELIDPDSFKIRNVYKINYKLDKEYAYVYKLAGIYDNFKTLSWEVEYSAKNYYGGTITDRVYISSTYYYSTTNPLEDDEYIDKTDYSKRKRTKKFVNNVKKLTKYYYNKL